VIWAQVFPGVYRFRNARMTSARPVNQQMPVGPNRGYSRMQHLWFLERSFDICAHQLGIAPDEMRLRNYIPSGRVLPLHNQMAALRFRQLSQDVAGGEGADWLGGLEEEAGRSASGGMLDGNRNRHYAGFRHEQFWSVANRESQSRHFPGILRAQTARGIYGGLSLLSALVRKAKGHEIRSASCRRCPQHPSGLRYRAHGIRHPNETFIPGLRALCESIAVSGLSAVHGAAQKLKTEMKRLAAFLLESKEESLNSASGSRAADSPKDSESRVTIGDWQNIVNVELCRSSRRTLRTDLECDYIWRAPFKFPTRQRNTAA